MTTPYSSDASPVRTNESLDSANPDQTATLPSVIESADLPRFGPPAAPGEVGRLGKYRIVKELGRGGMGAVYLAHDDRLRRPVALKVMLPKAAAILTARERFLREARAAAAVASDHVVTIYEAEEIDGIPYIALQFLQGCPLDDYLKKHPIPSLPQTLQIAYEAALGLAAAHQLGLVHRDIKPANLWLEAPNGRVKVLDFGLAKTLTTDGAAAAAEIELTGAGAVLGTPSYMAPEQGKGQAVDARADLFSLGCVLYRLCTGRLPFEGPSVMVVLMALATVEPKPVRELNPQVPEELAELIRQLMAKEPAGRPASAAEVAARLRRILDRVLNAARPDAATVVQRESQGGFVPLAIPVEAQSNPFADLNLTPPPESAPVAVKSPGGSGKRWLAAMLGLAGLVLAGGVVITIRGKDGSETKIAVPDGATVKVTKGGQVVATVAPADAKPKAAADPDRAAAEYVLSIGGIVQVNDQQADIRAVAGLPAGAFRLTRVGLFGNNKVTDAGLAHFQGCKNLTLLHLERTPVTDAGLAHFQGCKNLTYLNLGNTRVTDAGLAHFQGCNNLTELGLPDTPVTDAGLAHFQGCKNLTYLNLGNTRVTDAGLAHFQGCKNLTYLNLERTPVTDAGLAHFQGCKNLTRLHLGNTRVTDAGLSHFQGCKNLTELGLERTPVTDAGLAHFQGCKNLTYLNLERTPVTDAGLAHFQGCKNLTRLHLERTPVTDAGLAHFQGCKNLTYLHLGNTRVTDAGLAHFQGCNNLTELGLPDTPVTDAGLAHFQGCKNLTYLNLGNTRVTDAGLAHFQGCKNLTRLHLERTPVTDAGLAHFQGCKNLTRLHLGNTRVTDAGLAQLQELKGLTFLHLKQTRVTDAGIEKLAKALPRCRIEWDGGIVEPAMK